MYDPNYLANLLAEKSNPLGIDPSSFQMSPVDIVAQNQNESWLTMDNLLGTKDKPGLLSTGFGLAKGIADSWLAMQKLDLAKEQFGFQKDAFNKQYENQRTLTNSRLEDRQRARLSANPNAYQSVGDYMKQNGV